MNISRYCNRPRPKQNRTAQNRRPPRRRLVSLVVNALDNAAIVVNCFPVSIFVYVCLCLCLLPFSLPPSLPLRVSLRPSIYAILLLSRPTKAGNFCITYPSLSGLSNYCPVKADAQIEGQTRRPNRPGNCVNSLLSWLMYLRI